MSNKRDLILIILTFILSVALLCALDALTRPLIEKSALSGEMEPLFAVMPGASGFEKMERDDLPDTVDSIYRETSGMGYVVKAKTNKGFTGNYITLTVGISSDGKVVGITLDDYPETKDFGSEYPLSYIGADSTLSSVDIVAGVTYSSSAFRNAVNDTFTYLVSSSLVKGVEKSPEQKFDESLSTLFKEGLNPKGLVVADEFTSSVPGVTKAYIAGNKSAVIYLVEDGGASLTVLASLDSLTVYDADGNISSQLSDEIREEIAVEASSSLKDYSKSDLKKIKKMHDFSGSAVYTKLSADGIHSSLTSLYSIDDNGSVYYGMALRPYGFGNEMMTMYILLSEEGKIVSFSAKELIIEADYFSSYEIRDNYYDDFIGLDSSWSGDEALVAGATLTSDAVKEAVNDAFAAYAFLKEEN